MVGAAASVASMVLSPAVAVFIMAGVCIANVPYAAYKEIKIVKFPGRCHILQQRRILLREA